MSSNNIGKNHVSFKSRLSPKQPLDCSQFFQYSVHLYSRLKGGCHKF